MDYKRYGGNKELYQIWRRDEEGIQLKVVMEGDYRGRHFVIGAHCTGNPNAYLEVEETDAIKVEAERYDYYDGGLSRVNGGSTYYGEAYWDKEDKRTYVGWDYGHCHDYSAMCPQIGGKKWDLIDILMEIASAESEIETMNENDPEYWNRMYKKTE